MSSSTTLKDRLSHVSDTTPVSGLSDAARHAAGKAGTVAHRAASIAGDTAGTAASATRDAGVSVAHRISDVSGAASRGGAQGAFKGSPGSNAQSTGATNAL